jgi:predicted DsbA family dithiol-disulfide isomerase
MKDYPGQIRIVKMNYVVHPDRATIPAYAACAAQRQGKFFEMEHIIWEKGFGKDLSEPAMLTLAGEVKLDMGKFKADMASDSCKTQVTEEMKRLSAVGVSGTPAFFINGRFLSGARPIEQFKTVIDEELKKADAAIAGGKATPENYYQTVVVQAGKKSLQ